MLILDEPKICSCGVKHLLVPFAARYMDDDSELSGYYFECSCLSTLFIPLY